MTEASSTASPSAPSFNPRDIDAYIRVRRVIPYLPIPLVGSVAFNGNKETREMTVGCYQAFEQMFGLLDPAPKHILEIGTHAGHSSAIMLALTRARVVSVDIGGPWIGREHSFADWGQPSEEGGLLYVHQYLRAEYGAHRFKGIIGDSTGYAVLEQLIAENRQQPFDLAFIDGNHAFAYVQRDMEVAVSLGIKHIVADDLNSDDNGDVYRAAQSLGLEVVREWKELHSGRASMGLLRVPSVSP